MQDCYNATSQSFVLGARNDERMKAMIGRLEILRAVEIPTVTSSLIEGMRDVTLV